VIKANAVRATARSRLPAAGAVPLPRSQVMCEARDALPPLPKKKDGPAAVIDLKEHPTTRSIAGSAEDGIVADNLK